MAIAERGQKQSVPKSNNGEYPVATLNNAHEAPDNFQGSNVAAKRPIDLAHLANQTQGDKNLEIEILQLFARQARQSVREIAAGDAEKARIEAHRLTGSALAVGAVHVAEAAAKIEELGIDKSRLETVCSAVIEAENFICGLIR